MPRKIVIYSIIAFPFLQVLLYGCKNNNTNSDSEKNNKTEMALLAKAQSNFPKLPDTMPGSYADTKEMVMLGKALYFDKRLSINNSQSCNSCHPIDNAGADHEVTGLGALAKYGNRNDPSTFNAGFQLAQFWDGRAVTLQEQASKPIFNPIEMAMPNENFLLSKLKEDNNYIFQFKNAFAREKESFSLKNITKSLAAYERTLVSKGRFDLYIAGNINALNNEEKKGLNLFMELRCTNCHFGPNLGGEMFQKIGFFNPYKNSKDLGRYAITKKEGDRYVFKVPMLRNVALTFPYFHDGSISTLDDAVREIAYLQLNRKLSPDEVALLVAFLKSLSGDHSRLEN